MQETNGGCDLPCWWGITPGQTLLRDAKQILAPLRNFQLAPYRIGFALYEYANVDVTLRVSGVKVSEILILSSVDDNPQAGLHYDPSWRRYFLTELLSTLGQPSAVWIGFGEKHGDGEQSPGDTYSYELYILYRDVGLLASYAGPAERGTPSRGCVTLNELTEMRIFIVETATGTLEGPPWDPFTDVHPLEEATDLTVDEFYALALGSAQPICLESDTAAP